MEKTEHYRAECAQLSLELAEELETVSGRLARCATNYREAGQGKPAYLDDFSHVEHEFRRCAEAYARLRESRAALRAIIS